MKENFDAKLPKYRIEIHDELFDKISLPPFQALVTEKGEEETQRRYGNYQTDHDVISIYYAHLNLTLYWVLVHLIQIIVLSLIYRLIEIPILQIQNEKSSSHSI